jgi:hypothetical protein
MQLPLIDDARSIQKAISDVLNALAAGTLDPRQARVMLYGLQIAATNARHLASQAQKPMKTAAASDTTADQSADEGADQNAVQPVAAAQPESPTAPVLPQAASPVPPQEETGRIGLPPAVLALRARSLSAPATERETAAEDAPAVLPAVLSQSGEGAPARAAPPPSSRYFVNSFRSIEFPIAL